jgi:hypothetical protein
MRDLRLGKSEEENTTRVRIQNNEKMAFYMHHKLKKEELT